MKKTWIDTEGSPSFMPMEAGSEEWKRNGEERERQSLLKLGTGTSGEKRVQDERHGSRTSSP